MLILLGLRWCNHYLGDRGMTRKKVLGILLIGSLFVAGFSVDSEARKRKYKKKAPKLEAVVTGNEFEELSLCQRYWAENLCSNAVKHCQNAIASDPEFAEAHYVLGWVAAQEEDNETAKTHFEEFVKLQPTGPQADEAKRFLAELSESGG